MIFLFLFLVSFFISCSNSTGNSYIDITEDKFVADYLVESEMVKIFAAGKYTYLGTDDKKALANERPKMMVKFNYNFSISKHEVTRSEFYSIMTNISHDNLTEIDDSIPMANVTLYDAILYANKKSILEGYDTAYIYSQAKFNSAGNCILLESLKFLPEVNAYRLPTESEWVFVASNGWNINYSWNLDNSSSRVHTVCSLGENSYEVCDMEGNLSEWVNDWMGLFDNTNVIEDYLGSLDGGILNERIIKGGHFNKNSLQINKFSRNDVYMLASSDKFNYVGFRLAFGAIPNGNWSNFKGSVESSNINVLTNTTELRNKFKTFDLKLVYKNEFSKKLSFIDFSSGGHVIADFDSTENAYHPEISPNGSWVSYSTKPEGVSGLSSVYVLSLVSDSIKKIKLDVKSAAIPRWKINKPGDTVLTYVSSAKVNSDKSSWLKESTWEVSFRKGKFGTPKKLFDGSFNGGISLDKKLAVSGARILRVNINGVDSVWYNEEQACNASLQNSTQNTLFLDFGGKMGREFVGENYKTHERILVVDKNGNLIQSVKAPQGYTFDHTEWVSKKYAIATLVNLNGNHEKVVLVDMDSLKVFDVLSGDDIWHPDLWVGASMTNSLMNSSLDSDSAAAYLHENFDSKALMMKEKMYLFWKYLDSINVVILGSSRSSTSVDATFFSSDVFAINMSIVPNIVYESRYVFENYLVPLAKKLKAIVICLDIDRWYRSEQVAVQNFFAEYYRNFPGYVYDENHNFWRDDFPKGMSYYNERSFNPIKGKNEYTFHRGMQVTLPQEPNLGWGKNPPIDNDSNWMDYYRDRYYDNFNNLVSIIELAEKKSIKVLGVIFPQSPAYKKTGAFGRYGLRRSEVPKLIKEIDDLSKKYSNFKLLDENKMGNHSYPDSLAFDYDHLHNGGSIKVNPKIDSLLHTFDSFSK